MDLCVGILEVQGLGPAFVVTDQALKNAIVEIPGIELNSLGGLTIKMVGDTAAVQAALESGVRAAAQMKASCVPTALLRYPESLRPLLYCQPRYSSIIQDRAQLLPTNTQYDNSSFAIGILETKGFVATLAGADSMLKAAEVHLIGKEKIGATYVEALIRGDVSAVRAAVDAGTVTAKAVGTLIGGYVIARPHKDLLALLPQLRSKGDTPGGGAS